MTRAAVLLLLPLLAACAAPQERVETVAVSPPATLLTCRAAPSAPRDAVLQSDVARYVVRLAESGQDCRDKLGAVRRWVETEAAP